MSAHAPAAATLSSGELRRLILAAADTHALPPAYVYGVVMTESDGDPAAFNHEPDFERRYVTGRKIETFGLAREDEAVARATSYGLMQVMGQVAREHGFRRKYLTELCTPEVGLDYGCRHLASKAREYFDRFGWPGVFAAYNAGSPRFNPRLKPLPLRESPGIASRKNPNGERGWLPPFPLEFINQDYVDEVMRHAQEFNELDDGDIARARQTAARQG